MQLKLSCYPFRIDCYHYKMFYVIPTVTERIIPMGMTARQWIGPFLLLCPHRNNNLAAIYGQKCLFGSFKIQVGSCETLVEPKTGEGLFFEKATPQPGLRLADHIPGCSHAKSLVSLLNWLQPHLALVLPSAPTTKRPRGSYASLCLR